MTPSVSGKRIKVLVVLEATLGGTRKHVLSIAEHIDRRRFEVAFALSPTRDPASVSADAAMLRARGFTVFEVAMTREPHPISDIKALLGLYGIICGWRPDILHSHASKAGILGRVAACAAGVRVSIHTPHLWAFNWEKRPIRRHLYAFAERMVASITDEILPVSRSQMREALDFGIAPRNRMQVLPNAVDALPVSPSPAADTRPFTLGTAARLTRQKGLDTLLCSFAKALKTSPGMSLAIAGSGEDETSLRKLASSLGITGQVTFAGEVAQVSDFLRGLDLYVQPSRWEGLPYAIMEAMAAGVPVVAADVNGVREVVLNGVTGMLVPPENPEALASAILDAHDNKARFAAMAAHARELVGKRSAAEFVHELEWRYLVLHKREAPFA
ncbi:MAG: glycosyltransferase family 4 protein [Candidatus Brocadiia bacterium]